MSVQNNLPALVPLKTPDLEGFSKEQLAQHHDVLYAGYIKKLGQIEQDIPKADLEAANGTYSELGELLRQQSFATNGVALHQWYFENLTKGGVAPSDDFNKVLVDSFGDMASVLERFKAAGLAARGWVVLAYSAFDGNLHLYSQDAHDKGAVWACVPLLIMDVYEHAYMIDYGVKRKDYIDAFFKNIDWSIVELRYQKVRGWRL